MRYVSHRGNISGVSPEHENSPDYIDLAISKGYDVEVDVRIDSNGELFLGHDYCQYKIDNLSWLDDRRASLFVHCKDFNSLNLLIGSRLKIFYHQNEKQTIIDNCSLIWSHDFVGQSSLSNCIIPLISLTDIDQHLGENGKLTNAVKGAYGICSDYIETIKGLL